MLLQQPLSSFKKNRQGSVASQIKKYFFYNGGCLAYSVELLIHPYPRGGGGGASVREVSNHIYGVRYILACQQHA